MTAALLLLVPALLERPAGLLWRERMRAQRHIRPHVNPLQRRFQQVQLDTEAIAFARPAQPLHVDIGCGKGHFCADLAAARPDLNVLGIEIREPLVDEARRLCALSGSGNLRFVAGSANVLLGACCEGLGGELGSCSVQFPDPWPKRRHAKRRVVQPDLAAEIGRRLRPGGFVFLQSDVQELLLEMRRTFLESGHFEGEGEGGGGKGAERELEQEHAWLGESARPFDGVQTERERQCARRGLPVWRATLLRAEAPATPREGGGVGEPLVPPPSFGPAAHGRLAESESDGPS